MRLKFTSWFIGLGLLLCLFACSDHRLGGSLSPVRLRLKTVQGGAVNTNYTYDSQNRLATITKATGNRLSIFVYDNLQSRVNQYADPTDQATGTAILFPSNLSGLSSFVTTTYGIINTQLTIVLSNETYRFDSTNQLAFANREFGNVGQNPSSISTSSYTSTGENITQATFIQGRVTIGKNVYEYDNNINPFFGLTDPSLDDRLRFSRNNIVKETTPPGWGDTTIVYEYEYNAQNLPTKRTKKQGGTILEVLNYSYESY